MKLIALDVGTKRIGVAKADSAVRIAVPYAAVEVDGTEFQKIATLARAWDIKSFVLGMPRNAQGEETEQSRYVRKFAERLKKSIPDAKICFQDESLTSVEAEKRLKGRKKSYKKGDIDSEAATIILQDFLEQHVGSPKKTSTKAAVVKHRSVKANKPHRWIWAIVIIVVLLGALAGGAYLFYDQSLQAVISANCNNANESTSEACTPVLFVVDSGASVNDVSVNLGNAGLIRNAIAFQLYYRLNYNDQTIKPGEYELNKSMRPVEIIEEMVNGDNDNVFRATFLPGSTVREIRKSMLALGYTEAEVDQALTADYSDKEFAWIFEGRPEGAGLEGYLYGDTYEFYVGESAEKVFERMFEEMATVLKANDLPAKFTAQGLNLYEGITLASVVQKEAHAPDQAKVAQIFYNRLHAGMNLGSDVTTQYALDLVDPNRETYTNNADALTIDSPYNTRLHPGLPYGPIANPGLSALEAAATPDSSMENYLFFLTGDDGVMYYGTTEEEHNNNIREHCREMCDVPL